MTAEIQQTTKQWLQSETLKNQIAQALPNATESNVNRFMRCLFTQIQKTPKLLQCDKASLATAFIKCGELGIVPNGELAYLIPYKTTCQVIIGYKGIIDLMYRNGNISNIHADVVCEGEKFVYSLGQVTEHQIDFSQPRKKPFAAYCIITMKDGTKKCEVMQISEIETIRQESNGRNSDPWTKHYNEMAKKTVIRRASKHIQLSPEMQETISADDDQYRFNSSINVTGTAETVEPENYEMEPENDEA